jgi:AcrR family transcriptional regulator
MNENNEITSEQAILKTAEKLFLDKGFALTSTTMIAKEAGCNQALVHYYFRTKEKLFQALFEKKFRYLVSLVINAGEPSDSFEERLVKKIETHFDYLKKNPKIPFLFFNELTTNPARLEMLKERISDLPQTLLTQFESELETEIKRGNIRKISAIDLLITFISLNVAVFIAAPVLKTMFELTEEDFNKILENRKNENITVILKSLKP